MSETKMFVDGSVYSPVDPYATAMLSHGGKVEWVGQDAGANSILDDSMLGVELDGRLISPAFVAAGVTVKDASRAATVAQRLAKAGYAAATVFTLPQLVSEVSESFSHTGLKAFVYAWISTADDLETLAGAHGIWCDPRSASSELIERAVSCGLKVSCLGQTPEQVEAALALFSTLDGLSRLRASARIDGVQQLTQEQIDVLAQESIALGFSSLAGVSGTSVAQAVAAGVTVLLGSDTEEVQDAPVGWELALQHVAARPADTQISARAAFNALTRGVYRALGEPNPAFGQLAPGAPADFAIWQVTELMVQTPDSRVSAWSTDPRARIPLLPVLEEGSLPVLDRLFVDGQEVSS